MNKQLKPVRVYPDQAEAKTAIENFAVVFLLIS